MDDRALAQELSKLADAVSLTDAAYDLFRAQEEHLQALAQEGESAAVLRAAESAARTFENRFQYIKEQGNAAND